MFRSGGGHAVSAAVYCGGIAVALAWLLVFTLVFALVLSGGNSDLDRTIRQHDSNVDRIDAEIEEKEGNMTDVTETINEANVCLQMMCAPTVYNRIIRAYRCLGCWNANTNSPLLTPAGGTQGDLYVVCVAGSTLLGNVSDWAVNNLVLWNDDESRWVRAGVPRQDLADNGTHVSLVTGGTGNALTTATVAGEDGFGVARIGGGVMELDAPLPGVTTQVRDYDRLPYNGSLTGATAVANATNSVALSPPGSLATTPAVVREHWTRSGDILEAYITVAFKPAAPGAASVTLDSWPTEIVDMEFGGTGNASTVLRNTVTCSMVLSNADESIAPAPNGTLVDISSNVTDNGCFVNPPPGSPGLAEDTALQLFSVYDDVPASTAAVDAYNHQLWRITFTAVAAF